MGNGLGCGGSGRSQGGLVEEGGLCGSMGWAFGKWSKKSKLTAMAADKKMLKTGGVMVFLPKRHDIAPSHRHGRYLTKLMVGYYQLGAD